MSTGPHKTENMLIKKYDDDFAINNKILNNMIIDDKWLWVCVLDEKNTEGKLFVK